MFNKEHGYLFKFNNSISDSMKIMHCIQEKTYKAVLTPLDSKSFRDSNGGLHRHVVKNVPAKIEFKTLDGLTDSDIEATWGAIIRQSYTVANERKVHATFWIPEINDYVTKDFYVADPEFTIKKIRKKDNGEHEIVYEPITFKFIGY